MSGKDRLKGTASSASGTPQPSTGASQFHYVFLSLFVVIAIVTMFGVTHVLHIDDKYLYPMMGASVLAIAKAVIDVYRSHYLGRKAETARLPTELESASGERGTKTSVTGIQEQRAREADRAIGEGGALPAQSEVPSPERALPALSQLDVQRPHQVGPYAKRLCGDWIASFEYVDGRTYHERISISIGDDGGILGRIVPSLDNCEHTAAIDHLRSIRLNGSLNGTNLLTGIWFQSAHADQHGAFQLRVWTEGEARLDGAWLAFSESRGRMVSGAWNWTLAPIRVEPIVGIYGISGAGKTSICDSLRRHSGYRTFAERDVIEDYMRRIERAEFSAFTKKSEAERMAAREAAFSLHIERATNSTGVLVGDAHFSLPPQRLGSIEQAHPEAEHGIQPVMPDAAWHLYSSILYIDTPAATIRERLLAQSRRDNRNSWAEELSRAELDAWQDYDRRKLALRCGQRRMPFRVVRGDRELSEIVEEVLLLLSTKPDAA